MTLNENLRICLLALASRYPDCVVAVRDDAPELAQVYKGGCSAEQTLQSLERQAPQMLDAPARLLIDEQRGESSIYLLEHSQERPAFRLYCGTAPCEGQERHRLHESILVLSDSEG